MWYVLLLAACVAGDQLLKWWVVSHLEVGQSAPLLPGVMHPLGVTAGVLILGGGIGNVIDRVCRGYVVDMFDLLFIDYPIFNLADCFVVIGVVLGAVYYLWFYDKYDKKEPKDDAASES